MVKSNLSNLNSSKGLTPLENQLVRRNVGGKNLASGDLSNPVPKLAPPTLRHHKGVSIRTKLALQPKVF